MDKLYEYMQRLLADTTSSYLRYMYSRIKWENRMLGLVGPRGVGKTTLFLQHIQRERSLKDTLFISADHMYFADHTLYDTAESFYKHNGLYLYIDEVHKYAGWSRELKAMYDAFPGLHIYFTGSSILDIEKGEADLSRRAPRYEMQGLSFREFLGIRYGLDVPCFTLQEILDGTWDITPIQHPLPYFQEYLRTGYYPFGDDPDFPIELDQVISRTLEVDIPEYASMNTATGRKLKQLMAIISTMVPFKPNATKLASQISASRNNLDDYLLFMEKAGMIARLQNLRGLSDYGKVEKIYLDNPNILYNLSNGGTEIGTVRETFFLNQVRVNHKVGSSPAADFEVEGLTFEIGGKSKTSEQIAGIPNSFVVKDDLEYGYGNVIPLWAFGLLY